MDRHAPHPSYPALPPVLISEKIIPNYNIKKALFRAWIYGQLKSPISQDFLNKVAMAMGVECLICYHKDAGSNLGKTK